MEQLQHNPDFRPENASRVKAIFDAFTANSAAFHEPGGLGYTIVVELVLALNRPNPRLAARFLKRLDGGYRLDPIRRGSGARSSG